MKRLKNKGLTRIGLTLLAITAVATSVSWAASIVSMRSAVTEYDVYQDVMNWNTGVGKMNYYTLNGETAFCVQSGRAIRGTNGEIFWLGKENAFDISFAAAEASRENSLQSKVAYLGYYSKEAATVEDYAFTQMLIWHTLPQCDRTANGKDSSGNFRSYFVDSDIRERYESWKAQIMSSVESWDTAPDFGEEEPEIEGGEKIVLEDGNGVLKDYESFSYEKNGVKIAHNKGDNFISVEASYDCGEKSLTFSEEELRKAGAEKYKSKAEVNYLYQTEKSQDMSIYGFTNSPGMELAVKIKPIGELSIIKKSEGGFLSGINFTVESEDGSYRQTVKTDKDGRIHLEKLPAGKYTVTEEVPYGFVKNQPQSVYIEAGKDHVLTFENRFQKGVIKLEKMGETVSWHEDGENGSQPVTKVGGIAGAEYEVIACDDFAGYDGTPLQRAGDVAAVLTTDHEGKAETGLLYLGRYIVRERKAPPGYLVDTTEHEVALTYDEDTVTVETELRVNDAAKTGRLMMEDDFSPTVLSDSKDRIVPISKEIPKTGDDNAILLYAGAGASVCAVIAVEVVRRRLRKND